MNILGIVPARGGSKGIPHKNLADCAGKPLVCWTLDAIQESKLVNYAVLSSDDDDILGYGDTRSYMFGGKVLAQRRPVELAQDSTPTEPVISYVLSSFVLDAQPDIIVLLQPTSPIRTGKQIDEAVQFLLDNRHLYDSVLSVVPSHAFLWSRSYTFRPWSSNYDYANRQRRQDLPPQYEENGSIYVTTKAQWDRTHNRLGGTIGLYVMDESSRIQIDTPLDLAWCDWWLRTQGHATPPEAHRA